MSDPVKRSERTYVRVPIPRPLYNAILKIQVNDSTDFNEAALKAAALIDSDSAGFRDAVQSEASRLAKSQYVTQLNAARQTIRARACKEGEENVRRNEDNFRVPCSDCAGLMYFSSHDSNWERERAIIYEAFNRWHHTRECPKKTPVNQST